MDGVAHTQLGDLVAKKHIASLIPLPISPEKNIFIFHNYAQRIMSYIVYTLIYTLDIIDRFESDYRVFL